MTPTTKAGRALHADPITRQVASYPHPSGVTECWLCRHIIAIEREAAAEAEALRAALERIRDLCLVALETPIAPSDERLHRVIVAQVNAATPAPAAPAEPER